MEINESAVSGAFLPMNCEIISEVTRPPTKKMQIVAALIISMGILSASTALDVSLDFSYKSTSFSNTEVLWLIILLFFGGFVGIIIASILMRKFGRRILLITVNVPFVSSWLLIIGSQHLIVCILGRLLAGISIGIVYIVAPIYLYEIADFAMHGALVTLFPLFLLLGNIISISVTFRIVTYRIFIIFFCFLSVCQMILLLWMPDSPNFLLEQNRHSRAASSLKWLWGKDCNVHDTLEILQSDLEQNSGSIKSLTKNLFYKRENIISLIICVTMMCLQQWFYFLNIHLYFFSYDLVDPILANLSFSIVQLLLTILIVFLVEKVERRKILFFSCSLMAVSYLAFRIYFASSFTNDDGELIDSLPQDTLFSKQNLPLLFSMIFNVGFGIGINSIPWLLMVELFTSEVRIVGVTIPVFFHWVASSIISNNLSTLIIFDQEAVVNTIFAASTILLLILIKVIPETKGKTSNEIKTLVTKLKFFKCQTN